MVFPAPLSSCRSASHDFTHMVHSLRLRLVLEWHLVELREVLLDLHLAQEIRAAEAEFIRSEGLVSTRKNHLMADEVDLGATCLGARFLETRCDRWLDALWAHVLLKLQPLHIVFL